jgi:hypothetical protein
MRRWTYACVALVTLMGASPACADLMYSIGNNTPPTMFFIQGQSFTPSIQGNRGVGTPTASPAGTVFLTQFGFDFDLSSPFGVPPPVLYIYGFEPSEAQVSNGGQGSLGAGTHIGGGVYAFDNLELPFSTKSFAVLPESRSIFDGSGHPYAGGVDLFPQGGVVREGNGDFDAGFTATFTATVPEPGSLLLFGIGTLSLVGCGWRRYCRGRCRA